MLHKVEIFPVYDTLRTKIKIDGEFIRATSCRLTYDIDELPYMEITMPVATCVDDGRVVCVVENKEEIARVMDETEFEEFCRIWKNLHREE